MTKQELRDQLQAKGVLNTTKSQDPLWRTAFDEYNKVKGQRLNINCGGCWSKVREWLLS